MGTNTPRDAAVSLLLRFEKTRAKRLKADSLISDTLGGVGRAWSPEDRALFTTLVYGVLRWWPRLDFYMIELSRFPLAKLDPQVRTLLRLGFFQLVFLDGVPDYAAINSTVELARSRKLSTKTIAFLNATLRGFQRRRQEEGFKIPVFETDPAMHLSLEYALPMWFARRLLEQYGPDEALAMARLMKVPPPLALRVNTLKTTPQAFTMQLEAGGIPYHKTDLPEVLVLVGFHGSPQGLPGYNEGWFYVQDPSSAQVAHWVNPQAGERILDLCAAPGSKTTHMAALAPDSRIVAVEPVAARVATLRQNLARLGVSNVEVVESCAEDYRADNLYDRVLVDAPCSGLGTVRKHPEILIQMVEKDIATYPAQQIALLKCGSALLKPGGVLVYSTCSLEREENQQVLQAMLAENPYLMLEEESRRAISPDADGFYLARLRNQACF